MEWTEDYSVITNIIGVLPILPGQGTRTDSDNLVNKLIDGRSRMNRYWRMFNGLDRFDCRISLPRFLPHYIINLRRLYCPCANSYCVQ